MNQAVFIKSFSKGQITIPKKIRDSIGLSNDFWLKVSIDKGNIIAEPIKEEQIDKSYPQKLLTIKGDWFSQKEFQKIRLQTTQRLKDLYGQNTS